MAQQIREPDRARKRAEHRQMLANTFPKAGKTRPVQNAAFLGIGLSTYWKYVSEGRIKQQKISPRVTVTDAAYIRELAESGIPEQEAAQ